MSALRETPLNAAHRALGGRMVPFAGFSMPVQYSGIVEEHRAVRERAGLFDVSHMGQIHLRGPGAAALAERLLTCRVDTLRSGRVRYGCLCAQDGGVIDDVTIYREADEEFFLCVNAANIEKDLGWILRHAGDVEVEDRSETTCLLALQGPRSPDILRNAGFPDASDLRRFRFAYAEIAGASFLVSRTGYTGADGYEIYGPAKEAPPLWEALLEAGRAYEALPAGLGARDTLRLEAAFPLYGHELDATTTPIDAGLDRFVKRDRGGFIGADAIAARAASPGQRRLTGFTLLERGVARADCEIIAGGERVGRVTSGGHSPTLKQSIGLGYVPQNLAAPENEIEVRVRDRTLRARTCETPFVG